MKKIYVIIPYYKDKYSLIKCLESIGTADVEILVVDNSANIRGSDKFQGCIFPKVLGKQRLRVIINKRNLGFAGGCNVGIRYAMKEEARAVFLLNQDGEIKTPDFFEKMWHSGFDIAAPLIRFKRGNRWVEDRGGKINWWLGRTFHIETEGIIASKSREMINLIDYVSGCAMMIKRPVFEKIGLLDDRYFLYFEDVDFCLRARKSGFTVGVNPSCVVIHYIKEKEKKPPWQQEALLKSNLIFINRWVPIPLKLFAYFYWSALSLRVIFKWAVLRLLR